MRNAISTKVDEQKHQLYQSRQLNNNDQGNSELYWTDQTYGRKPSFTHHRNSPRGNNNTRSLEHQRKKRCYVCNKTGCWSNKHPTSERKSAYERYRQSALITNTDPSTGGFQYFLVEFEGTELDSSDNDEIQQLVTELEIEDVGENYFTEFGPINGTSVITDLHDQSAFHVITGIDRFDPNRSLHDTETFMLNDRYSSSVFQGIMPDTGAAGVSTAGLEQTKALQRQLSISIDKSTTGQHRILFGKGETVSIGSINVPTPFGLITFHVVPTKTPFLLCLKDMDALNIKFDNLKNVMIQYGKKYPVVRKLGHPWLLLNNNQYSITFCHLTETELRQIHRRFGHPSVRKLSDLLLRADEEFDASILHKISKLCHQFQLHGRSPGRFRFNIRDDIQFNSEIVVDVMYLDNNRPVLDVVDTATEFQSARFLKSLDAKTTWDTLRLYWIDIYNGPPDFIVHDARKNFVASEFKQNAQALSIDVKPVPVEAHNSIGKVERYQARTMVRTTPTVETNHAMAAQGSNAANDPDAECKRCKQRHLNRECFKQHPELAVGAVGERYLARKAIGKGKGKGKSNVISVANPYIDSESEDGVAVAACASSSSNTRFAIYNTGASHHFVPCESMFRDIFTRHKPIKFDQAVGKISLTRQGTARIVIGSINFDLHDCLYSPNSSCIIISAGRLQRLGSITPDDNITTLTRRTPQGQCIPIARLIRKNDVYYTHSLPRHHDQPLIAAPGVARVPNTSSAQRWHQRLGLNTSELSTCETCHLSKAQRYVSQESRPTPFDPLDEVFIDTVGKLTTACNGQQYAVIITDAKSRMRWAISTCTKDQIAPQLVKWVEHQHHQYGKRVRTVFRDGGSGFFRIKSYCEQHGIRADVSAPRTPEQNGTSEASNKVILRRARSMLIDARMPACYWPWAVEHAYFITNRLYCLRTKPVPLIDFLKGLKQPHSEKIDFTNLPRFGYRAYKLIDPKPGKFEPRAEMGCFWANLGSIFSEPPSTQPPYPSHDHTSNYTPSRPHPTSQPSAPHQYTAENQTEHPPSTPHHSTVTIEPVESHDSHPPNSIINHQSDSYDIHTVPNSPEPDNFPSHSTDLQVFSRPSHQLADQRKILATEISDDEAESTEQDEYLDHVMTGWDPIQPVADTKRPHSPEDGITRSQRGRAVKRVDYYRLHHGMTAQASTDPQTWDEAMTSPEASHWKRAAEEEFQSLKQKGSIRIIPHSQLPKGRKPMKCKWVFKKKFLANGDIEKYKARCTAKGFTQRQGIDYHETFAPTPRPETGRIILVLAHQLGWHRKQGDVPTAFLNPDLNIDLFMELPRGYEKDGYVIRLCKGLYGLKQAAALWYDDAKSTLAQLGLLPTTSDICLYTNSEKDIFVLMHVDDFQVVSPHQSKIDLLMSALYRKYNLKTVSTDLFLGIEISHPALEILKLSQGQYTRTLLNRHGLTDCKPANTPMERMMEANNELCTPHEKTEYNSCI
ncbi:hypothetical protein K3495_g9424 [Podosphaera aphanis]|nr:hypothetical protein K3495_g9424 [Podosphaera aphanis]